jgi:hypothetical protein
MAVVAVTEGAAMVLLEDTEKAWAGPMEVMALTTQLRCEAAVPVGSARESRQLRHAPVVTGAPTQPPPSTMTARTKTSATVNVQGSREPYRAAAVRALRPTPGWLIEPCPVK